MDSVVLARKEMLFHGIWKAGYRVGENLIKSIGADVLSKPSRLCTLKLTSAGLSLELPSSPDGRVRKTDQVSFDSLRDIFINSYQATCLTIIYLDSNSRFSVLACSSQNQKDLEDVSRAYRNHRNLLLQNPAPQASLNWMLLQKLNIPREGRSMYVKENNVKSSTLNGGVRAQGQIRNGEALASELSRSCVEPDAGPSQRYVSNTEDNIYEDVLLSGPYVVVHQMEDLVREPARQNQERRPDAFSVGTQTAPHDDDEYDIESITSTSTQNDAATSSDDQKPGTSGEKSQDISADVYYSRNMVALPPAPIGGSSSRNEGNSFMGKQHAVNNHQVAVQKYGHDHDKDEDSNCYLRSAGTQTVSGSRGGAGRYRKQMLRSISNSYKEKAEVSKKKNPKDGLASGGTDLVKRSPATSSLMSSTKSGSSHGQASNYRSSVTSGSSNDQASNYRSSLTSGSSQRLSVGPGMSMANPVKRTLSLGSTTVIKPIETVYLGSSTRRSLTSRSSRPFIIYAALAPNRFV